MASKIKTLYVVHHSHTDIGYTDLQEHVIDGQIDHIRSAVRLMRDPQNRDFRWNCETYYCVEEFLKSASQEEKEQFFQLIKSGEMGISATYLNFNDLLDSDVHMERVRECVRMFREHGISVKTAMTADINGFSMGQRDALIENGVEFFYTNIHTHHGMYPLYQNQNAYWWENAAGKRLLVWNGEHYNLGNALGLKPNRNYHPMTRNIYDGPLDFSDPVGVLHTVLSRYLEVCEENGYPYDFIVTSVSGVFSDNAPPALEILRTIEGFRQRYPEDVEIRMVSLQELYAAIAPKLQDAPVYRGDLNDWWANGVGSTPYAVKHYREAQRRYHLCGRLDAQCYEKYPDYARAAQDNLLLYAEHTWGHSSTITNPFEAMVVNLDMRKNSYASKAHESASRMLNQISAEKGGLINYYNTSGKIRALNPNSSAGLQAVEFYIESPDLNRARITDETGREIPCQVSPHPRGRRITFLDAFAPYGEKVYTYEELPAPKAEVNSRKAYVGADRIRDVENDYETFSYQIPYAYENKWFKLAYEPGKGVTSFVNKKTGKEMLSKEGIPFFTPIYERTPIRYGQTDVYEERRLLGRNIRGQHAKLYTGELQEVVCREHGPVFTLLELKFKLEGAIHCSVWIRFYENMPRIEWKLELGKTISMDIESVFLPLDLQMEDRTLWIRKGTEAFRPGIDQLPGSGMEYYMSDDGLAYVGKEGTVLVGFPDVPLIYMGEMRHHPIRLCDNKPENNRRPVYSWVMNNTWETNFKMDLSGFCEFCYSLELSGEETGEAALNQLRERSFAPYVLIIQ
ncbi:MAG TPA: hypothetical protein IAB51_12545 [Candidatus Merdivicinus excrementipullorum]|uniref:Glycoside hydrolase family 38 N-terminal domain-containing protein n=1 Tax=Candidatus Merdivicinus excrementipullorum TaxID=2840867 RepID=A0A9D1FPZ9_9FIRM|nr:hypothetical protein [Candidatus Merdivicinus excrementipullorum]